MTPTFVVIPTRWEPERLRRLLAVVAPDATATLLVDTGHDPALADLGLGPRVHVLDPEPGASIYGWWNQGWRTARQLSGEGPFNLAVLNDDVTLLPGSLSLMARCLRSRPDVGAVYPDTRHRTARSPVPRRIALEIDRAPDGPRELTGFCFMFRGELPLPLFDEGYTWWYGDTQFDESVRLLGYGVARVVGLPVDHRSDAEANDWARRPELKQIVEQDGVRWAELHQEIRANRWWPISEIVRKGL